MESGVHRARVITKSGDLLKPKIEMTSLVRPSPRYGGSLATAASASASAAGTAATPTDLDLMAMYERKNARLDAELGKLQRKLDQAQKMLAQVTKELDDRNCLSAIPGGGATGTGTGGKAKSCLKAGEEKSAYVLKLVRENELLRSQLEGVTGGERHARPRVCLHGRTRSCHYHHHCHHIGKENVAPGGM